MHEGRYQTRKLLGKGATGTVYLAWDALARREVALKVIDPELLRDPEVGGVHRTQFENEASLAGKLRHPHIVSIFDAEVGEASGHVAMELVTGGDLSQYARPDKLLAPADVLQIGFKCCRALDYAYREQGIVHRDLKPANIMVAQDGEIRIADFGASFLRRAPSEQDIALGSPYYIAPEQIEGRDPTVQSDMYSLGVVLYELLVGRKPFDAQTLPALVHQILHAEPLPPSEARSGLPRGIDGVLMRVLHKDPARRYPDWPQFALALASATRLVSPAGSLPASERYLALAKVETLRLLNDGQLWEIVAAGKWTRRDQGAALVTEGETGRSFFFLAQGRAKVTRQRRLLTVLGEGEWFGEMAYLRAVKEALPRHATVEALNEVVVAEFEPHVAAGMSLVAQLHVMRALARNLADRLALATTGGAR